MYHPDGNILNHTFDDAIVYLFSYTPSDYSILKRYWKTWLSTTDEYVIYWDVNELYEIPDEPNDCESHCHCSANLEELPL